MDILKILDLIKLETMGSIGTAEYSDLLKSMENKKDFPWKELGEYQNLVALLSMMVRQESPSENLKERVLSEIKIIRKSKLTITADTELIEKRNKIIKLKEEHLAKQDKNRDESISINDTDMQGLKIVDHPNEFEEVKSKLFRIKDHPKKSPESEFNLIEKDFEDLPLVKSPKPKKSVNKFLRKRFVIVASVTFIFIAVFGFFYFNFFNADIEDQIQLAKKETEMLVSKSRVLPEEQEAVISVENIGKVEPESILPEQKELEQKETFKSEIQPEESEQKKEKESQKPAFQPPQAPNFIEAPLVIEDEIKNPEESTTGLTTIESVIQVPPKEEKIIDEEPVYFIAVEEMPEPIGGISAIQKMIVYPEIARRAGIEGKVLVLAFVDESGNVTKAEVIKGIGLGCDEAAINAIIKAKFKPGKQRGKSVKVQVTIPVTFKL